MKIGEVEEFVVKILPMPSPTDPYYLLSLLQHRTWPTSSIYCDPQIP